MSTQSALRSALRCTNSRFPHLGSLSSTPISSLSSTSKHGPSNIQSSSLHTAGLPATLNVASKPFTFSASETKFSSFKFNGVSPVVMSAQLSSSTEATEAGDEVSTPSTLEDSDSVDDADGRRTSKLFTPVCMEVPPETLQTGYATTEGTTRFSEKFKQITGNGYFRTFNAGDDVGELVLPSIGIGEYRGKEMKAYDRQFSELIENSLNKGVNLFDTSHLMRNNHCERVVGNSIASLIASNKIQRDEIIVCTKGGMILREKIDSREYSNDYLNTFVKNGLFEIDDVAAPQCMKPSFLEHQLDASRKNLGLETIDVYYIQNIECQINKLKNNQKFYDMLKTAFEYLEKAREEKKLNVYGFSARSDNFITNNDDDVYLSLEKIVEQAKEVGGDDHHLKFFQLPVNISATLPMTEKTQTVDGGEMMSTVDAANKLGLYVVSQATDFFTKTYRGLSDKLNYNSHGLGHLASDATKSMQFSRKITGVGTVLFTTRRPIASNSLLSCVAVDC